MLYEFNREQLIDLGNAIRLYQVAFLASRISNHDGPSWMGEVMKEIEKLGIDGIMPIEQAQALFSVDVEKLRKNLGDKVQAVEIDSILGPPLNVEGAQFRVQDRFVNCNGNPILQTIFTDLAGNFLSVHAMRADNPAADLTKMGAAFLQQGMPKEPPLEPWQEGYVAPEDDE